MRAILSRFWLLKTGERTEELRFRVPCFLQAPKSRLQAVPHPLFTNPAAEWALQCSIIVDFVRQLRIQISTEQIQRKQAFFPCVLALPTNIDTNCIYEPPCTHEEANNATLGQMNIEGHAASSSQRSIFDVITGDKSKWCYDDCFVVTKWSICSWHSLERCTSTEFNLKTKMTRISGNRNDKKNKEDTCAWLCEKSEKYRSP